MTKWLEDRGEKMKNHTHKGVLRSDGGLRSHPISRKHLDPRVQRHHDEAVNKPNVSKSTFSKATFNKSVMCPVDRDGFIYVDLTDNNLKQKGLRVKFVRKEGRKRRTVGLEILK